MGYTDYAWYAKLTAQKIFFVTRQKRNARYDGLDCRKVNKKQGLLSRLDYLTHRGQSPGMLRSLTPHRLPRRRHRHALCLSHQPFQAGGQDHRRYLQGTLADRDLLPFHQAEPEDQGLHRQLGKRRADPVYTALIVYLLLCYLKFLCNLSITLQSCIRILQLNLFRTCILQEVAPPRDDTR